MGWLRRLLSLVRRRDLNAEIDEELQFHVDAATAAHVAAGLTPDDARRLALTRFGHRTGLRDRTREMDVPIHVERFWQDLRHGLRVFARHPGLTAIAVVSIAFGTGANLAVYTLADALLLRPLPVPDAGRVLTVGSTVWLAGFEKNLESYRDYLDIRDRTRTFASLTAFDYETVALASRAGETPRVRFATFVADNFFSTLGVDLALGRPFLASEVTSGAPAPVAILSDAMWRSEFGADPKVVGRRMRAGTLDVTIVGVAPPSFFRFEPYVPDEVFLPITLLPRIAELPRVDLLDARDARLLTLKGRLRPSASIAEARAEMAAIGADLARAFPATNTDQVLVVQTETEYKIARNPLDASLVLTMTILSIVVLAIACANVAGLFASRGPARSREMALRLAIGASRGRLVRQLLTESLAVAVLGAIGGAVVGHAGVSLLKLITFPTDLVMQPTGEIDGRTLALGLAIATSTAILASLGPALQTTRVDLTSGLRTADRSSAGRARTRGRFILVAAQVGLSLVAVTVATFAVQAFDRELVAGPGFHTTQMAKVTVDPGQARMTLAESAQFLTRLTDEARRLPGVASVTMTSSMPLFGWQFASILPMGAVYTKPQDARAVYAESVDEQYFDTMGIPLLRGRAFTSGDDADSTPVAIVNDTLVGDYWPDSLAVGRRLQTVDGPHAAVEIVGVSRTGTYGYPGELPKAAMYFPYRQRPYRQMVVLARTAGASSTVVDPLRTLVTRLDANVPVFDSQTIEAFYDARMVSAGRVLVQLAAGLGVMGLSLTMIGLYALVSYAVSRRTREIGIRIAIGATYGRILRMILDDGMRPAWYGLAAGLVASVGAGQLLRGIVPLNHRVGADTFFIVVPLVVLVTLVAAFVPARRAARVDPTSALRTE